MQICVSVSLVDNLAVRKGSIRGKRLLEDKAAGGVGTSTPHLGGEMWGIRLEKAKEGRPSLNERAEKGPPTRPDMGYS